MSSFDHHSTAYAATWRDQLRSLRAECPVATSNEHGGFVVVTRHDDAIRVLRDQATFASGRRLAGDGWCHDGGVTIPSNQGRMGMMEMDPPDSVRYRRLLAPWFSRGAIAAYRPRITELVTWCIDGFADVGTADIVADVANPLPALVTLDFLGLPLDRWKRYAGAIHGAAYRQPGSGRELKWLMTDVREVVDGGAAAEGGVIDHLVRSRIDGDQLPADVVCELVYMLLNGGVDTTTSMLANAVIQLQLRRGMRDALIDDPRLIPRAVQELIRYCAPSTGVARTVLADTEIGGVPVAAGERVLVSLASANFDESRFDAPDDVAPLRDPNPHLSFGTGAHRCLGADLATTDIEIFLAELLRRLPDVAVDLDRVEAYPTMPLVNGFVTVPVSFSPEQRRPPRPEVPVPTKPRLQPLA